MILALGIPDNYTDEFATFLTYSFDLSRFTVNRPSPLKSNLTTRAEIFQSELDRVMMDFKEFKTVKELVLNVSLP